MTPKSVELSPNDGWVLLLSTIRYSLGRSTYMTSLSWELALNYSDCLEDSQLEQMIREIREEVDRYRRIDRILADESTWLRGAAKLQEVLDRRSSAVKGTP